MPSKRTVTKSRLAPGLVALFALAGCGGEVHDHPVRVELIASVDSVRAGEPFVAGVLLTIEPGWHVYWKYSGDAGLPTEIQWELPEGWSVGELQWPIPRRFVESGPLTTFGYTDSVLLTAEVRPPDRIDPGAPARLAARIDWMVCHEECIPGKAAVALDPQIASDASSDLSPASDARFDAWRERLPLEAHDSGWRVDAESSPGKDSQNVDLRLNIIHPPDRSLSSVEWFPAPGSNLLVKNVNVATLGGATVVVCSLRSIVGPIGPGERFESLLVYHDAADRRRGVRILTSLTVEPVS